MNFDPKDIELLNKYSNLEILEFVSIGFCQPKFYKVSTWNKAKLIMEIACKYGLAYPFDYGRGKGKYSTHLSIEQVKAEMLKLRNNLELVTV